MCAMFASGLTPGVNYQFFVTVRNGVSGLASSPPVFVPPPTNPTTTDESRIGINSYTILYKKLPTCIITIRKQFV